MHLGMSRSTSRRPYFAASMSSPLLSLHKPSLTVLQPQRIRTGHGLPSEPDCAKFLASAPFMHAFPFSLPPRPLKFTKPPSSFPAPNCSQESIRGTHLY